MFRRYWRRFKSRLRSYKVRYNALNDRLSYGQYHDWIGLQEIRDHMKPHSCHASRWARRYRAYGRYRYGRNPRRLRQWRGKVPLGR